MASLVPKQPLSTEHAMQFATVNVADLKHFATNPRQYKDKHLQKIVNSIARFGFNVPILVDQEKRIIAGNARVKAATMLGMKTVPAVFLEHLSEAEIRAFRIADNKITENPEWDNNVLLEEFLYLLPMAEIDIEAIGFEIAEVDRLMQNAIGAVDEQDVPEPMTDQPSRVKPGDIWHLGSHRLICGNSLDPSTYAALMSDGKAHIIFADPPYNVRVDGHVRSKGSTQHREFAMASGEMNREEFASFLQSACQQMDAYSHDGSLHYICIDWAHMIELLWAGDSVYTELKNICVWNKDNAGMGSLYRSKHEMIVVYKKGKAPHVNNIALGKYGRYRTNVWDYPGANSRSNLNRKDDLTEHPTVKPCAMVCDVLLDCSKPKQIVLDPFAGSGTTLLAAEKTNRIARCIEIDPHYCDVIIKRWEAYTGKEAVCMTVDNIDGPIKTNQITTIKNKEETYVQ